MAWMLRAAVGLTLALTAGAAMAQSGGGYDPYYDYGYATAPPSQDEMGPSYGYARQHYAWPCACGAEAYRASYSHSSSYSGGGELNLPYDADLGGGVGPIPSDGYGYGYGYGYQPRFGWGLDRRGPVSGRGPFPVQPLPR